MTAPRKRPPPKPKAKLLLLRVAVQPVFAYITDDGVVEVPGGAQQVPAQTWAEFAANAFTPEQLERLQAEYEAIPTDH